ncbi:MAG TPA: hypothetical protein VNE40_02575 [Candidatus Dormibacteraeota bacterium]|nr:hypothetical protein [Candidatus Dormibacteraeota bacterium]
MVGKKDTALYAQVVQVTRVYFGPTAERFITRQIQNHLHKLPQNLSSPDLKKLIDWIHIAVSLLTENTEIVDEYMLQLERLTHKAQVQGGKASAQRS